MATSILLVEDHTIVRRGIAMMLRNSPDLSVVGEATTGTEALRLALKLRPNMVLMDVGLPDMDGAALARQLVADLPGTRVLALSAFSDRRHVVEVMHAGASGYVLKDCVLEELLDAIETVSIGQRYLSPKISAMLLNSLSDASSGGATSKLTPREAEVLQLLAEGKAMKEAAVELHISTKTVETHRRAIMEKLQLFSVAELTKHAIREGLTTVD